jgi:type IV pilus assembly protein PilB
MLSTLASLLYQARLISAQQLEEVDKLCLSQELSVIAALHAACLFPEGKLTPIIAKFLNLRVVDLSRYEMPSISLHLDLQPLMVQYHALPIERNGQVLSLAVADPLDTSIEHAFQFATGLQIELLLADFDQTIQTIKRIFSRELTDQNILPDISDNELAAIADEEASPAQDVSHQDSPVSRFINQILLDAVRKKASDIHFEPYEKSYRIRFRCDGILVETERPAAQLARRLASRIKILAKLDIAEKRLPQDGRIKLSLNNNSAVDIRVSSLPTIWGEKLVLRILDISHAQLDIEQLGYSEEQKQSYLKALQKPQGMILMTGPTGSGKTVSLYSGLKLLNTPERNIATVEDPIEINLEGINQVQINEKIGFGFAQALRAFLRQDPDIVMVGEIRDLDTAQIAIKAAQTGHLVLSTLHTNSASQTLIRLRNMGIENYNLTSSISLIIAQRLARKLCKQCRIRKPLTTEVASPPEFVHEKWIYIENPNGCHACTKGYIGRVGIYEIMTFDNEMSQAVLNNASSRDIEKLAQSKGMQTLRQAGIEKVKQGLTSFSELQRVLYI